MDTQRLSAILLIAGFVGMLGSTFLNAPGLYQTQDIERRLEIVQTHRQRWLASQAVVFVSVALLTAGFAFLAFTLQTSASAWVPILGTAAITVGSLSGIYFVYLQTTDPRGGYSGAYPTPEQLAYWAWLAGQLLFGVALLQTELPAWIGYLTAGSAALYGIVFLITGAGFMAPFLLAFLCLLIGIVLLRQ